MSKLFEAISNLEADNGQAVVDSPFRPDTTGFPSVESRGGHRKTLAIAIAILIISLAAGSGALFLSKRLAVPDRKPISKQDLARGNGLQGKIVASTPGAQKGHQEVIMSPLEYYPKTETKKKEGVALSASLNGAIKKANETGNALSSPFTEDTSRPTQRSNGALSGMDRHLKKSMPRPKPLNGAMKPAPLASNPLILNNHEKRLLYRAEKLRKNGLKEQALAIYQRVWKKSRNPLVANNLAAMLMEKGRYQEALKILEQAVKVSPSDGDIKYNLEQLRLFLSKTKTASR